MKKVACFTDSLGSGGAQRQLVGLATLLKNRGYDIDVVLYYDIPFYKHLLDDAGVNSYVIANTANPIKRIWTLYCFFLQKKYDVVIAYQETPSLIACLLRPLLRWKKLIVSERNTTQTITRKDRVNFFLYRFADKIVPNSHTQFDFLKQYYPHYSCKLVCITNFVNTDVFSPKKDSKFNSVNHKIVSVGRIMPQKNVTNYLQAIKKIKDKGYKFQATWVGANLKDEYYNKCRVLVDELDISDVFQFQDVTNAIVDVYQQADIFCLPSVYEGFPNVVCEAMSCGLPVLCGDVCDNRYIVEPGINGFLFNPLDVNSIAGALEKMINLKYNDYLYLAKNNRNKAVAMFSSDVFINSYINIIDNV